MGADNPQIEVNRYLDGLVSGDDMQSPPGRPGDPQLAALIQFFQGLGGVVGHDDIVIDIGSGKGMVGHGMLSIFPDDAIRPWYYAVDLEEAVDQLSLPTALHNHSQKVSFDNFIANKLLPEVERVKAVVVRNVLHELNIQTTANLIVGLSAIIRAGGCVYIQDIASLTKGERGNVGWPPNLFCEILKRAGFDCGAPAKHFSRSGTEWFSIIVRRSETSNLKLKDVLSLVAEGRERQLHDHTNEFLTLGQGPETLARYVRLSIEIASLQGQIQQHKYASESIATRMSSIADVPIVTYGKSALDYVEEMPAAIQSRSGLKVIISSKHLIDLPALILQSTSRLWFAGYSQRLLFRIPEVRAALHGAVAGGVDVRLLMVDPESPAAAARSLSEAYPSSERFFEDVSTTEEEFIKFREEANTLHRNNCSLRFCQQTLSASYFFVDDNCICSLYSSDLTGGSGAAFVFRSSTVQPNGYFQVLLREFQSRWGDEDGEVK